VHRAAFAFRQAAPASGEFGHHALGVHAESQHVAVIAIAGDDGVALFRSQLHAGDDRFLADIEMAETADQTHAIHLARLLLEAADQQHHLVGFKFLLLREFGNVAAGERRRSVTVGGGFTGGFRSSRRLNRCHGVPLGFPRTARRPLLAAFATARK
jgi:hypothetical protein